MINSIDIVLKYVLKYFIKYCGTCPVTMSCIFLSCDFIAPPSVACLAVAIY